jgi:hypothetical protein
MASEKLTQRTELAAGSAVDDQYMVVDTSDTTGSASGTSKRQTTQNLFNSIPNFTELNADPAPSADHFLISDNGVAKKITYQNMHGIYQTTIALSEANITNLNSTPITCVAAVSGHVITPIQVYAAFTHGTGAQSGKASLVFYLDGSTNIAVLSTQALSTIAANHWQYNTYGGNVGSTHALDNLPLKVTTGVAFTAGVFTACSIIMQYRLLKVS